MSRLAAGPTTPAEHNPVTLQTPRKPSIRRSRSPACARGPHETRTTGTLTPDHRNPWDNGWPRQLASRV